MDNKRQLCVCRPYNRCSDNRIFRMGRTGCMASRCARRVLLLVRHCPVKESIPKNQHIGHCPVFRTVHSIGLRGLRHDKLRSRNRRLVSSSGPYAEDTYGCRDSHRRSRTRRAANGSDTFAGIFHEQHAESQQSRQKDARLRDYGCHYCYLHRQDRHSDPEQDASLQDRLFRQSRQ